MTLRAGRSEDAENCGSICYEAFKALADQHNFPPDLPSAEVAGGLLTSLLSRGDIYSVVAEVDGRGLVATSYGRTGLSLVSALSLLIRVYRTSQSAEG